MGGMVSSSADPSNDKTLYKSKLTAVSSPAAPGQQLVVTRTQDYLNCYLSSADYQELADKLWFIWINGAWSPKAYFVHEESGLKAGEIFFPEATVGTAYSLGLGE